MLLRIPRSSIGAASLSGELLLREAHTGVTALIRANGALASNSVIVGVAHAFTSGSVAASLVRALDNRVGVVSVLHFTDPGSESVGTQNKQIRYPFLHTNNSCCHLLRASSSRAIRESPSRLAINSVIASALVIRSTSTVAVASVGAISRDSDNY